MCLSIAILRPNDVLTRGNHRGFEWMVTHNGIGYRCGYVRMPVGHPWHGKDESSVNCTVHGGITFAEPDVSCGKGADDAWWIGFDCCHSGDAADEGLCPAVSAYNSAFRLTGDVVRTQEYVESECCKLCDQAANALMGAA